MLNFGTILNVNNKENVKLLYLRFNYDEIVLPTSLIW